MNNEDFAYIIEKERNSRSFVIKKPLKMAGTLLSLVCFILITVSAYYFVSEGQDDRIEIVKSPNFEIKTRSLDADVKVKNADKTIYSNIIGSSHDDLRKDIQIVNAPTAAEPALNEVSQDDTLVDVDENIDRVHDAEYVPQTAPQKPAAANSQMVNPDNSAAKSNINAANNVNQIANDQKSTLAKNQEVAAKFGNKNELAKIQNEISQTKNDKTKTQKADSKLSDKTKSDLKIEAQKAKNDAKNDNNSLNVKESKKKYSRVQLAALKSEDLADQYWSNIKKDNPSLVSGLKNFVQKVDLGKRGVFYRLQIGNFKDQLDAEDFCIKYIAKTKAKKSDCIIVE